MKNLSTRSIEWIKAVLAKLGKFTVAGFILAGLMLYGFIDLVDEIIEGDTAQLDNGTFQLFRSMATPFWDVIASFFSLLGAEGLFVIIGGAALGLLYRRRWGAILLLVIGVLGAQILNSLLKSFIRRERPLEVITNLPGQTFSFPSGHAMVSLVAYGILAALIWRHLDRRRKGFWISTFVLLVASIGLSRIYLGHHYLTDVIGGYIGGSIWLLMLLFGSREVTQIRGSLKPNELKPET